MFVGSFKPESFNPDRFQGNKNSGVVYSNNVSHYCETSTIEVFLEGVLYNKEKIEGATCNDAQTIARLYLRAGTSGLSQLDGSFVVIIICQNTILISRDHHGAGGQVYYSNTHFASSLALLQQTPDCPQKVNHQNIATFLSVGYIPTGTSCFVDIRKLPAGAALVCTDGKKEVVELFDTSLIEPYQEQVDTESLARQYGILHREAIKRRIGTSENVGILLSGGYDSGANLAALRAIYNGPLHSYSVGFKGDSWSELPLAGLMSAQFGTTHHQYEIDGSEIDALPEIVRALGDPFVEGGLMVNYTAMRMVGEAKPDVILGGDGSDQYFGTSAREVAIHYLSAKYGAKPLLQLLHRLLSHRRFDQNNTPYRIHLHLSKILNILQGDVFGFERFQLQQMMQDKSRLNDHSGRQKIDLRSFEHLYTQHTYRTDIERIINQVILFKASSMASLFDNTIAFPYMDLELYNFLQRVPVFYKCKNTDALEIARGRVTSKYLLKYHYKPILPEAITSKKKQGGFAPMPIFFADKQRRDRLASFILDSSLMGEVLKKDSVAAFVKKYDHEALQQGNWFWYKQNKAIQYFNLLNMAIWWETYVKSNPSVTL